MDKEELISLINALSIEEVSGINISYYKEKEPSRYDQHDRKIHIMTYGDDINRKIDVLRNNIDNVVEYTNKRCINTVTEMLNEYENKKRG